MTEALLALHYQNDICHPDGRIPFALVHGRSDAQRFLAASRAALAQARRDATTVVHVHIGFAADYSDLPRNCTLFQKVEEFGAVKRGSWGASPYEGFEPVPGEHIVPHTCNSGFRRTDLEALLRERNVDRVAIIGLATQFSVEHTARDAADIGFAVTVLSTCCASADKAAHAASLRTLAMLATVR